MARERRGHQVEGGCCALVVVYLLGKVYVANAGEWTVACQVPLSVGFSRQEYWSGLPFPSSVCSAQNTW